VESKVNSITKRSDFSYIIDSIPILNSEVNEYGQQSQPPTYGYNNGQGHVNSAVGKNWNKEPRFQDLWATILFLIQFVGFLALSYVGIKTILNKNKLSNSNPADDDNDIIKGIKLDTNSIVLLVVAGIFGFFLSLLYMALMQKFPKPLIKITLYLSIATYFIAAAIYGYVGQIILAVMFAIFGVIYLICAFTWRDRIPFAAILLETITTLTKKYYGTIIMGFAGLIVQVGWSIWWALTVIGAFDKFFESSGCEETTPNNKGIRGFNCKDPYLYIVLLFLVFNFYWTSQVIKTVVHVTDSGVFATYYFLDGTAQGVGNSPTLSALKRACTTSFGSICFGSLIIAILNTIKAILRSVANSNDDACGFVAACFACLLAWIENLVEYFNHYAYVEVAIYGKSYCHAAKDTWKLIKNRGVEAIINDNLIGNVLTMGAIFIGVLCALFGYGYISLFLKDMKDNGTLTLILVVICFILGLMMTIVVTDAIDSGVATTFVALAEDPDALRRTKPILFERIRREWPS
ncbi:8837_t:CDS:2, partial [Funneliformis geosporum]